MRTGYVFCRTLVVTAIPNISVIDGVISCALFCALSEFFTVVFFFLVPVSAVLIKTKVTVQSSNSEPVKTDGNGVVVALNRSC